MEEIMASWALILLGLYIFIGIIIFNIGMNSNKAQPLVSILGVKGAKTVYGIIGIIVITLGTLSLLGILNLG